MLRLQNLNQKWPFDHTVFTYGNTLPTQGLSLSGSQAHDLVETGTHPRSYFLLTQSLTHTATEPKKMHLRSSLDRSFPARILTLYA
jgi:hypothetical protein